LLFRKSKYKSGSRGNIWLIIYGAPMAADNSVNHAQSQSRAIPNIFCSKKWLKYFLHIFSRNAWALIRNFKNYFLFCFFQNNFDQTLFRRKIDCIQNQIEDYLRQLNGVCFQQNFSFWKDNLVFHLILFKGWIKQIHRFVYYRNNVCFAQVL